MANLIRSKGFYEHDDKDQYRNEQKAKKDLLEESTRLKVKKALAEGTEEEKKMYREALSALNIDEDEFLNPEAMAKKKAAKDAEKQKEQEKLKGEVEAIEAKREENNKNVKKTATGASKGGDAENAEKVQEVKAEL